MAVSAQIACLPCTSKAAASFYKAFYQWSLPQYRSCSTAIAASLNHKFHQRRSEARQSTYDSPCCQSMIWKHFSRFRRYASSASPAREDEPGTILSSNSETAHLRKHTSNINIHPDLSTHMRHLMRKIPHPVVVITAATRGPDPIESSQAPPIESTFRGMTVSSFNTVTLEPTPLVSFNVRTPSATHTAMTSSGTFLAHFLLSSPEGARIADAFANGGNAQGQAFQELAAGSRSGEVEVFAGKGTSGAPLMAGKGVLQVLRCRLLEGKVVVVGDHRVVVAEVLGILAQPGRKDTLEEGRLGLVYGNQQYRYLGGSIDLAAPSSSESDGVEAGASIQRTIGLNVRRGDETGR